MNPYIRVETKFGKKSVFTLVDGRVRKPISMGVAYKKHRAGVDLRVRSKGRAMKMYFGGPLDHAEGKFEGIPETGSDSALDTFLGSPWGTDGEVPGLVMGDTDDEVTDVDALEQAIEHLQKQAESVSGGRKSKSPQPTVHSTPTPQLKVVDGVNAYLHTLSQRVAAAEPKDKLNIICPFPNGHVEDKKNMTYLYLLACMTQGGVEHIFSEISKGTLRFGLGEKRALVTEGSDGGPNKRSKVQTSIQVLKSMVLSGDSTSIADVENRMRKSAEWRAFFPKDDKGTFRDTTGRASDQGWKNTFEECDLPSGNKDNCRCAWCGSYMRMKATLQDSCKHTVELDHQIPKGHVGWLYIAIAYLLGDAVDFSEDKTMKAFIDNMGGAATSLSMGFVYICTLCNQTKHDMMPYVLTKNENGTASITAYAACFKTNSDIIQGNVIDKYIKYTQGAERDRWETLQNNITTRIAGYKGQPGCGLAASRQNAPCLENWIMQWTVTHKLYPFDSHHQTDEITLLKGQDRSTFDLMAFVRKSLPLVEKANIVPPPDVFDHAWKKTIGAHMETLPKRFEKILGSLLKHIGSGKLVDQVWKSPDGVSFPVRIGKPQGSRALVVERLGSSNPYSKAAETKTLWETTRPSGSEEQRTRWSNYRREHYREGTGGRYSDGSLVWAYLHFKEKEGSEFTGWTPATVIRGEKVASTSSLKGRSKNETRLELEWPGYHVNKNKDTSGKHFQDRFESYNYKVKYFWPRGDDVAGVKEVLKHWSEGKARDNSMEVHQYPLLPWFALRPGPSKLPTNLTSFGRHTKRTQIILSELKKSGLDGTLEQVSKWYKHNVVKTPENRSRYNALRKEIKYWNTAPR